MKRLAALTIALAVLGGCAPDPAPRASLRIEEDEAGWNCSTMGNRICGPVTR